MIYHSGTAAFGALLIAIVKMIRSFIAYLQRKAEEMNSSMQRLYYVVVSAASSVWRSA